MHPLERFLLAAQFQKRFTLEVEQVLLADHGLMRQRAAGEHVGERAADDRVVIGDASGAPCQVESELERGQDASPPTGIEVARRRTLVAVARRVRARTLSRRPSPLAIHRDAIGVAEKAEAPGVRGAGRDLARNRSSRRRAARTAEGRYRRGNPLTARASISLVPPPPGNQADADFHEADVAFGCRLHAIGVQRDLAAAAERQSRGRRR